MKTSRSDGSPGPGLTSPLLRADAVIQIPEADEGPAPDTYGAPVDEAEPGGFGPPAGGEESWPSLAVEQPAAPAADYAGLVAAQVIDAVKVYGSGETAVRALDGISVTFGRGQYTAIMGPSGSGKSTLMHCLAGLDRLTSGHVLIGEIELGTLSDKALTRLRRDRVGFVFQTFNLVPTLTAIENITLPIDLAGGKIDRDWIAGVVDTLRIGDRLKHKPDELSGGQQQRVAVARALATRPQIIFADEPTGNLDTRSGAEVLGIMRDSVRELGQTVVMVTHDPVAAGYADRAIFLVDGRVVDQMLEPTAERVLDQMKTLGG
jgi:putative ABC transport system ATP-binding protein